MPRPAAALSELARLGFAELGEARDRLAELSSRVPAVAQQRCSGPARP